MAIKYGDEACMVYIKPKSICILVLVAVIMVGSSESKESESYDLGTLGIVEIPAGWVVTERSEDRVVVQSADRKSRVVFAYADIVEDATLHEYLIGRALSLKLPPFVRTIDRDLLEKAHASEGVFILGTVPLDPASATPSGKTKTEGLTGDIESEAEGVGTSTDSSSAEARKPDSERAMAASSAIVSGDFSISCEPKPARYWMVAAYRREDRVFVLEAGTDALLETTMVLSALHRSWRLK